MWRDVICTVGADMGGGAHELLGPGRMAYLTTATHIVEGTTIASGYKVLVDADEGDFQGSRQLLITRIRPLAPAAEDLNRYRAVNDVLSEAGLSALAVEDIEDHLRRRFEQLLRQGASSAPDPKRDLLDRFANDARRFPLTWWAEDPEPGLDEMQENLVALGIDEALPRQAILDDFERRADEEDEALIRRHTCGLLARAANAALARAGHPERWCPFADAPGEDEEPLWLRLEPAAAEILKARDIIGPPGPIEATCAPNAR
jgi:hypothetical protein